jgi:superfamily II DNA or RNA helicase
MAKKWDVDITTISIHSLHKLDVCQSMFIIVDEIHKFKNDSQRFHQLLHLTSCAKKSLLISATPFDREDQLERYSKLLRAPITDLMNRCSGMYISYPSDLSLILEHHHQNERETDLYRTGMRYACTAHVDAETRLFAGALFTKGLKAIHASLINKMIEMIRTTRAKKCIAVVQFNDHVAAIRQVYPDALVLVGDTVQSKREQIISRFNHPSLDDSLLIMSNQVGDVGIELDDKHGEFPRTMIMLPPGNMISFLQLIGRIHRVDTRSNPSVVVVQPCKTSTFFSRQLDRKRPYIEQVRVFPTLTNHVFKHRCVPDTTALSPLPFDIQQIITEYACTCIE